MNRSQILIVLGSISDLPAFEDAQTLLKEFQIPYEVKILSAHRTPDLLRRELEHLPAATQVIIAAAGGAAHLAGVTAAHTLRPVIGVPMDSKLKGVDSFVSTSQMPAGIPVATMSIGKAGATNAALIAAQIIALHNPTLTSRLANYRRSFVKKIRRANIELKRKSNKRRK